MSDPDDFDAFWAETLRIADELPLEVEVADVPTGLTTIDVRHLSFTGFGGRRINAWLRTPRGAEAPLPGVVQFMGYGGGKGHPLQNLLWASAGYAHLVVDARGQAGGDTEDVRGHGLSDRGFLTRGLADPHDHYYRRVFADAVRAVAALRSRPEADPDLVLAVGMSQGGGIALAMAGLVPDLAGLIVQAPFLSDIRRGVELSPAFPYTELRDYLGWRRLDAERAFATLAYFDGLAFARRATAPACFSTGLIDEITPPEVVLAAYESYAGPKELQTWPFSGHEAGGQADDEMALSFAGRTTASAVRRAARTIPSITPIRE